MDDDDAKEERTYLITFRIKTGGGRSGSLDAENWRWAGNVGILHEMQILHSGEEGGRSNEPQFVSAVMESRMEIVDL